MTSLRTLSMLLMAATIGCFIWCTFLYDVLPMAVVEQLYDHVRPDLVALTGEENAQRIMRMLTQELGGGVRSAVITTAIPLLITNIGWGALSYSLLRKAGELRESAERTKRSRQSG